MLEKIDQKTVSEFLKKVTKKFFGGRFSKWNCAKSCHTDKCDAMLVKSRAGSSPFQNESILIIKNGRLKKKIHGPKVFSFKWIHTTEVNVRCRQGDQMSLWRNRPNCSPTSFFASFTVEKSSPIVWPTFVIFKKQPKVNNRPIGENSPNLVTLACRWPIQWIQLRLWMCASSGAYVSKRFFLMKNFTVGFFIKSYHPKFILAGFDHTTPSSNLLGGGRRRYLSLGRTSRQGKQSSFCVPVQTKMKICPPSLQSTVFKGKKT
jgi:hypothetical protein